MRKPAGPNDHTIFKNTASKSKNVNLYTTIYRGGIRF